MYFSDLSIQIENPKGSYKSFETEGDPVWKDYPLKGMTYPVDYGSIEGYEGEDGSELDVFVGSGDLFGQMQVWRKDVPVETKFLVRVTKEEAEQIFNAFKPVVLETKLFSENEFLHKIREFKK